MAAGQGFKTFTTGEVLTAGDVNGYLMQGINVFASNAARDAAITIPAEGQFAFTKDTNSLWYYDGAAWVASGATGDIEGVTAGIGISGGGTSGTVTVTNSMATAIDAKGDLVAGTGADAFSRLGVGANDTVLTADSGQATGLKWATPAAGWTPDLTLINSGGTALSGSSTVTVSGISGKNSLYIFATGVSSDTAGAIFTLRLNADSGSNYRLAGLQIGGSTFETAATAFKVATQGTAAGNEAMFQALIIGTNSTGQKVITAGSRANGTSSNAFSYVGSYFGSSAISSVSILTDSGSFDAGTIYIYGG